MNARQFEAVENALNLPVTKVTGPPGTGKSFMAVNLIANEVLSGGSVLFTSKNHKAIHAIFGKAPDAVSSRDFPLVSFCTIPGNDRNADWIKTQQDVDARVSMAILEQKRKGADSFKEAPPESLMFPDATSVSAAQDSYRDAEAHIKRYQELRDSIASIERLLVAIDGQARQLDAGGRQSPETAVLLEEIARELDGDRRKSFWDRIAAWMLARVLHRAPCKEVVDQLREIAPYVCSAFDSRRTLARKTRRLLGVLRYRELVGKWEREELDALRSEMSELSYDELKRDVGRALSLAHKSSTGAYVENLTRRISAVAQTDDLVSRCRAAVENVPPPQTFEQIVGRYGRYAEALKAFSEYLAVFPAWAATMLSLKRAAPCLPGVYSLAIIDEASQCDIPPMIPVLFRARRIAIIGDPSQFPPVVDLAPGRDVSFRKRHRIDSPENRKYWFSEKGNHVFGATPGKPVLLNEHFRCADEIADYFNSEFYDGGLSLCSEIGRIGMSAAGGLRPGMAWIDAPGGDNAEIEAATEYLKELKSRKYSGTIGIISPLRNLANLLKTKLADCRSELPPQLDIANSISTANGFQGGECDVILFLLGLNGDRKRGEEWYVTASENKYIYNVSVSRAKHVFVACGDRKRVSACGISYIQKLIPENRPPRKDVSAGPGERPLQLALRQAGIDTVAQYPVLGRYLDLAIPSLKIDIEVDGQAFHLDRNGCRKQDDIHRDILLETNGWTVVRVWHHEVVTDIAKCVDKVRNIVKAVGNTLDSFHG